MTAQDPSHGLFISYRREDVPGHAGRLYDQLSEHFGERRVFMDVDSIGLGLDFVASLEGALATCEVMLVVIGPRWLSTQDESAKSRLDDPCDYVRTEVQTALERGVRVVPVLIQGAELPASEHLPEPLRPLVRRQALKLGDATFRSDTKLLIERLETVVTSGGRHQQPEPAPPARPATAWEATLRRRSLLIRHVAFTLSQSSHDVEYEVRALRSNVLRVDGAVVGSTSITDVLRSKSAEHEPVDPQQERYEFSVADGSDTRTGVFAVNLGSIGIKEITLTIDGHALYHGT